MTSLIAKKLGLRGLFWEEFLDLDSFRQDISLETLNMINGYKTGQVFVLSFLLPAIAIGLAKHDIEKLIIIAQKIGIAFQIQDDLFGYTHTINDLGKDPLSDIKNNKTTIINKLGFTKASELYNQLFKESFYILSSMDKDFSNLNQVITNVSQRSH